MGLPLRLSSRKKVSLHEQKTRTRSQHDRAPQEVDMEKGKRFPHEVYHNYQSSDSPPSCLIDLHKSIGLSFDLSAVLALRSNDLNSGTPAHLPAVLRVRPDMEFSPHCLSLLTPPNGCISYVIPPCHPSDSAIP
jgi:hypothetical protein